MQRFMAAAAWCAVTPFLIPSVVAGQTLSVTPRGAVTIGNLDGPPFVVGELSGIAYAGTVDGVPRYWMVQDNSDKLVRLRIEFEPNGSITPGSAAVDDWREVAFARDYEGIALDMSDPARVFLSEEDTPAIHIFTLATGGHLGTLATPQIFLDHTRSNLGFESLTRRADGAVMWTANEEALVVDGPRATPTTGTWVRLLRFDRDAAGDFVPGPQFAYLTEPMHAGTGDGARNGLSELVVLPNGIVLALERSLAYNTVFGVQVPSFRSRLFELDFTGATDVRGEASLETGDFTPVTKHLLWEGPAGGGLGQNLEGLALGPALESARGEGRWSLLGVVDDGDPLSQNTVVAFELVGEITLPPAAALTSFDTTFGTLLSGDIEALRQPDGTLVEVRSQFGFTVIEPVLTEIEVGAVISPHATEVDLTIDSRLSTPGGRMRVRVRDLSGRGVSWPLMASHPLGTIFESVTIEGIMTAGRIDPVHDDMRVRIRHSVVASFSLLGFRTMIDQVRFGTR